MTPDDERLARRRAKERRICRRRLLISGAALGALAVGAGAAALVVARSSERESVRPPPPPPPQIGYSGSKLAPRTKARPRRSLRPSEAEQRQAVARFAELGLPILCGGSQGRFVALTFDDGPGPYTDLAMRILRRRGVRATFFLVGSRVELFPSLPAREAAFGALGDHTWTHRYLPTLPDAAVRREISSTLAIVGQTSEAPVLLFRPPYGGRTRRIDRIVRSFGLVQVLWSVDSRDSTGARVKGIYRNVLAGLKPGAIILMHENRARTIKSLIRYVLTAIQKRHYKMVTVPELLALDPPTVEQVRKRQC